LRWCKERDVTQTAKTLLFDFDHTLGTDGKLEERVLRGLAIRYCDRIPSDAEIAASLDAFRTGQLALDTMVEEAVASWGGRSSAIIAQEYRAVAIALVSASVEPMPGARELFALLEAKQIRHAVFSNGWSTLQAAKAAAIGYPGRVITSEEVGAWKPEAAAFQRGAARAGFDVRSTLYVGDSPFVDVAGAKGAGMYTVWADLEGKTYPTDAPKPDHVITWLPDVVGLVGG
jgi:HAD superfamily hydrolase (TIGR01509 family)